MEEGINLILSYKGKPHLQTNEIIGLNPHMSRLPGWIDSVAG